VLATVLGSLSAQAATLDLTGTIRDFCWESIPGVCSAHPDFETFSGFNVELGIVAANLGIDGKPVYVGGSQLTTSNQANFDQ